MYCLCVATLPHEKEKLLNIEKRYLCKIISIVWYCVWILKIMAFARVLYKWVLHYIAWVLLGCRYLSASCSSWKRDHIFNCVGSRTHRWLWSMHCVETLSIPHILHLLCRYETSVTKKRQPMARWGGLAGSMPAAGITTKSQQIKNIDQREVDNLCIRCDLQDPIRSQFFTGIPHPVLQLKLT